jgi:hypothetical protein
MDEKLKLSIYEHIDRKGFAGRLSHDFVFSVSLLNEQDSHDQKPKLKFIPNLPFDINEHEQLSLIYEYIKDLTNIEINLDEIEKYINLNGFPFIVPINEFKESAYSVAFKSIPGSLFIRGNYGIKSLGNIEEINGDLGFSDCELENLGNLKIIRGNIWTGQSATFFTRLKSLSPLEIVEGDCNLKMTPIETLGTLKIVQGNLNLRNTYIESIGDLEYVGGNILISKYLELDFSKVRVDGKIKYFND